MKKILSFKHWQLFILIIVCGAWISPSPFQEIINGIAFLTFMVWVYSISSFGKENIVFFDKTGMNFSLFKINVLVIVAAVIISWVLPSLFGTINGDTMSVRDIPFLFFGVYLFYAIFHVIIFTSKVIAMLTERREVSFGDYFQNLLQSSFFLLGFGSCSQS